MIAVNAVVVGLGYVGLPLAYSAVRAGVQVIGFDTSNRVVSSLSQGVSHIDDLSDADVLEMLDRGFVATTDEQVIVSAHPEVAVICVPTPLSANGGPDLTAVVSATQMVGRVLRPGMLVILESTTYPGTTEELISPLLEEVSGLKAGADFEVAFSPERVDPGNGVYGTENTPKVVGGLTPEASRRTAGFYGLFIDTIVEAKGAREAETSKLLENTFRHVNIALVNEMARLCWELDIDIWDVIRLAKTKPFGFMAFYPGVGVGGHCIPIDPNYLAHHVSERLGHPFRFVELAQEINATMPRYVAHRVMEILNDDLKPMRGSRVLLLGVTYKPNISDHRETPAVPLADALRGYGADVSFHDPYITEWPMPTSDIKAVEDLNAAVAEADVVVLLQNHRVYDVDLLAQKAVRFFDTCGVTDSDGAIRL